MNPADKGPGILDTSTVILLPQISNSCALPSEPMITAITLAELAAGSILASTHAERTYRQAQLKQAKADFHIIPPCQKSAVFSTSGVRLFIMRCSQYAANPAIPKPPE